MSLPEIFHYGFMQRAFLAGLIISVVAPTIGVFLVLRRLSLIADTLSHVALAGVAIGLILRINPVIGGLVAAIVGSVGVERLRVGGKLFGEAALAIFLSGGLAIAVILLSLHHGFNVDLFSFLFGAITTVQPEDLAIIAILGLVVLGTVAVFYKEFFAMTFDEESARVQGLSVDTLGLVLTILVGVTVVVSMRIVGILLISALIVIPAVTALRIARSFRHTLGIAIATGVISVLVGLTASFYFDLAAGGAIVASAIGLFALGSVAAPRLTQGKRAQ
jgi:zinc transport system permease protein